VHDYSILPKNRFFEVLGGLNYENRSDSKVAMLCEVDMSSAERMRERMVDAGGIKPSYTALVAKAVAQALRECPYANRMVIMWPWKKRIVQIHQVDVSIAVEQDRKFSIEQAVTVATIRATDCKDVGVITRELRDIVSTPTEEDPRQRKFYWIIEKLPCFLARWVLSLPRFFPGMWLEHRGGAALISSPSKYGIDTVVGTWAWPLGFSFGLVKERPVAVDGAVAIRPTMTVTMSFDRRLMAGAPAARFFNAVCERLSAADTRLAPAADKTLRASLNPPQQAEESVLTV
jgi:pyruvate/2-oxoglutarate dehydrogenase complex dihydrolipoamide acyltransferase (E2) component